MGEHAEPEHAELAHRQIVLVNFLEFAWVDTSTANNERAYQFDAIANTWGMDLSGSMQGAGGVGGLLSVEEVSSLSSYYPTFDGNGNVSEYIDSSGAVQAHYEYDAFGNEVTPVANKGTKHDDFSHRFSTKPLDAETGLYYYGYRYCAPSEAWRLLRGESPRRKSSDGGSLGRQELATRFVPSLAGVKEGVYS